MIRTLAVGIALLSLAQTSSAQFRASTPIADAADARFQGVTEDWTLRALSSSHLKPVPPLVGVVDERLGYTLELIQLQWRWGDSLDLYVMKPKGVTKPPVILHLYAYPADTDAFKNETFQKALTKDGFAAVGFVSALTGHRYHDRPMKEWFLSELQESLATSAHDVQMVLTTSPLAVISTWIAWPCSGKGREQASRSSLPQPISALRCWMCWTHGAIGQPGWQPLLLCRRTKGRTT